MGEVTTVKLTKDTKERLAQLGGKDETYDQIIQRLIKFYTDKSRVVSARKGKR